MVERDIYEVANQLGGYIDEATPAPLATFLRRESREAAKLAARIADLEAEMERLRKKNEYLEDRNEECEHWRIHWKTKAFEALSRTGAVKVKALEWWVSDSGDIIADSLVGRYRLGRVSANINFRLETPSGLVEKPAPDYYWPEVEAKAAAQADYERRILSALEPAAPEGQQEPAAWQHIPNCGVDRESKMVHVTGKVFCDPCVAPLIAALNAASIETVASCCGHGHRPGVIVLRDGRELFIAKDFEEARKADAAFPTDINGDARPSEQAVTDEMVDVAARAIANAWGETWECCCTAKRGLDCDCGDAMVEERDGYDERLSRDDCRMAARAALKAAMEAGRHD